MIEIEQDQPALSRGRRVEQLRELASRRLGGGGRGGRDLGGGSEGPLGDDGRMGAALLLGDPPEIGAGESWRIRQDRGGDLDNSARQPVDDRAGS